MERGYIFPGEQNASWAREVFVFCLSLPKSRFSDPLYSSILNFILDFLFAIFFKRLVCLLIYLLWSVLGLRVELRLLSSWDAWGSHCSGSPVAEHGLRHKGFRSCGAGA